MKYPPRKCSEFPNDNPKLHDGAVWICDWPRAMPRAVTGAAGVAHNALSVDNDEVQWAEAMLPPILGADDSDALVEVPVEAHETLTPNWLGTSVANESAVSSVRPYVGASLEGAAAQHFLSEVTNEDRDIDLVQQAEALSPVAEEHSAGGSKSELAPVDAANHTLQEEQDDPFVRELADLLSSVEDDAPAIEAPKPTVLERAEAPSVECHDSLVQGSPQKTDSGVPELSDPASTGCDESLVSTPISEVKTVASEQTTCKRAQARELHSDSFSITIDALPELEPLELENLEFLDDLERFEDPEPLEPSQRLNPSVPLEDLEPLDDEDLFDLAPLSSPRTCQSVIGVDDESLDPMTYRHADGA